MLASVSALALLAAIPTYEPTGWYGAIDAGYHYVGDLT
jgi:opacity protein-like surface antigen